MMSAAQYYPKLLSIMGNVLRFLPAFVRMKELLEEGYVGELLVCEAQVMTEDYKRKITFQNVKSAFSLSDIGKILLYFEDFKFVT